MYEVMVNNNDRQRRSTMRDLYEENNVLALECLNAALTVARVLEPPEPMNKEAIDHGDDEYLLGKAAMTNERLKLLHKTLGRIGDTLGIYQ